jgi:hypothetical protein
LTSDEIPAIAEHVRAAGLRFGFGGVARADDRTLPVAPDLIYSQYPLLGATAAWLARSFFRDIGHSNRDILSNPGDADFGPQLGFDTRTDGTFTTAAAATPEPAGAAMLASPDSQVSFF